MTKLLTMTIHESDDCSQSHISHGQYLVVTISSIPFPCRHRLTVRDDHSHQVVFWSKPCVCLHVDAGARLRVIMTMYLQAVLSFAVVAFRLVVPVAPPQGNQPNP